MKSAKEKGVSFYRLYVLDHGTRKTPTASDWVKVLKESLEDDMHSVEIDGVIYQPELDAGTPLLGIHKPVDSSFMTKYDPATGSVTDLMAVDEGGDQSFYSTAIRFVHGQVFAIALGAGVPSPRHTNVVAFLSHVLPLGEGIHWKAEPLMNDDQIKALQSAEGVIAYSSKYTTTRNLFNVDDPDDGILSYTDRLAHDLDAELEVQISIKLADHTRGPNVRKKLKQFIVDDLGRITADKKSNAKVTAVLGEGAEEELDLVAHKLAVMVELPQGAEQGRFSTLLKEVDAVGAESEDRVKQMIEGSS